VHIKVEPFELTIKRRNKMHPRREFRRTLFFSPLPPFFSVPSRHIRMDTHVRLAHVHVGTDARSALCTAGIRLRRRIVRTPPPPPYRFVRRAPSRISLTCIRITYPTPEVRVNIRLRLVGEERDLDQANKASPERRRRRRDGTPERRC
jgi:hypothetical protein